MVRLFWGRGGPLNATGFKGSGLGFKAYGVGLPFLVLEGG